MLCKFKLIGRACTTEFTLGWGQSKTATTTGETKCRYCTGKEKIANRDCNKKSTTCGETNRPGLNAVVLDLLVVAHLTNTFYIMLCKFKLIGRACTTEFTLGWGQSKTATTTGETKCRYCTGKEKIANRDYNKKSTTCGQANRPGLNAVLDNTPAACINRFGLTHLLHRCTNTHTHVSYYVLCVCCRTSCCPFRKPSLNCPEQINCFYNSRQN